MNRTISLKPKKPSLLKALLHAFAALGFLVVGVVVIVIAVPDIDPSTFGYAVGQAGFFLFPGVFLFSCFIQRLHLDGPKGLFKKFLRLSPLFSKSGQNSRRRR